MFRLPHALQAFLRLLGLPLLAAPLALAIATGLSACSSGTPRGSQPLQGEWRLVRLWEHDAAAQTLQVEADGTVSGHAGCNRFRTRLVTDGPGQLRFEPAAATKMACLEPGRMESETAFLRMLGEVRAYRVDGTRLVLVDGAGLVVAEFSSAE